MKRMLIGLLALLVSQPALAFTGGAGDAAIISQLKVQTAKLVEQLQNMRDALDINERMQEMEQIRHVRQITAEGKALHGIVGDIGSAHELIQDGQDNAFGLNDVDREIQRIRSRMDRADGVGDYAKILADLERLKILGQASRESMKRAAGGSNELDDIKTTATSSMIMSDLMIQQEARRAQIRAQETEAARDLFSNHGYAEMYGD